MMRLGGYTARIEELEKVVERLMDADKKGDVVYCDVDGYRLYSDNITMDSAYMAVTGRTKEEIDAGIPKVERTFEEREQVLKDMAIKHIPYWIEEGKNYIYEQRYEEWEKCVKIRANALYLGRDLDVVLNVMAELEKTSHLSKYGEARYQKMADMVERQSGKPYLILSMLLAFAKEGPQVMEAFIKFFDDGYISPELRSELERKKMENNSLEYINELYRTQKK